MMRLILIFTFLFISVGAKAETINNIRMGQHPDKTRIVFDFDGKTDFQAKIVKRHLTITLPQKSWNNNAQIIAPFTPPSHEIKDNYSTFSFPLIENHTIKSAYVIKGTPHRLIIDLVKSNTIDTTIHGPLTTTAVSRIHKKQKPIIVIDAGHGGIDPGAISKGGIFEKNITLSMAKTLAKKLNQSGKFDARLTRSTDKFIRLRDRFKIAQDVNADFFISIHADSLKGTNIEGASIYTLSKTASDEETAALAKRENEADNIDKNTDITTTDIHSILFDMAMEETTKKSKDIANKIILSLRSHNIKLLKGPHRHAGFAVLKAPDIPSVLFEIGFLSSENQAKQLQDKNYQNKTATALLKALERYFGL